MPSIALVDKRKKKNSTHRNGVAIAKIWAPETVTIFLSTGLHRRLAARRAWLPPFHRSDSFPALAGITSLVVFPPASITAQNLYGRDGLYRVLPLAYATSSGREASKYIYRLQLNATLLIDQLKTQQNNQAKREKKKEKETEIAAKDTNVKK